MFTDSIGRPIRYLRLSLTNACAMRCIYCRGDFETQPRAKDSLSVDAIEQLVSHLVQKHGLQKVRLTGGEPTSHRDILHYINRISTIDGLQEVALTTNGLTLSRMADQLMEAGLNRVNISLDTLDQARFTKITGVDGLTRVLAGIEASVQAGLTPVKLNTVVLRNQNDHELPDLVRFAADRGLIIRFIELMPMGPLADQWSERFVSTDEMLDRLNPIIADDKIEPQTSAASKNHHLTLDDGKKVTVGFISAMSCPFCAQCDRIRITVDGKLYPCLMDDKKQQILPALQPKFDSEKFDALLKTGLLTKAPEHPAIGAQMMIEIGG